MADATAGGAGDNWLRVETDAVLAAAAEFRSIADERTDGLGRLVSEANAVVDGSWRGQAAAAFDREWDEFHDAAKAIVDDADTIADLVAYSAKIYGQQDDTSAEVLRAVWVRPDA